LVGEKIEGMMGKMMRGRQGYMVVIGGQYRA
jgi:hypothetical protein